MFTLTHLVEMLIQVKKLSIYKFQKDTNKTIMCIAWEAHSAAFNISHALTDMSYKTRR